MVHPVLVDEDSIRRAARAIAGALARRGVGAGDRIAVLAGNSVQHVAMRHAAMGMGLWFVPVNPRLAPPEVETVVAKARARLFLTEHELDAFTAEGETAPLPFDGVGATILFTSGTTGEPKGCLRPEAAERARADELIATYGLDSRDVHLVACPLAHSAPGIFLRALRRVGARTALLPKFDAMSFLAAVARVRATVFFLVPTQVERLLALPEDVRRAADLGSVRSFIVAGAPFAPRTKERLLDWIGPGRLWEFYGSSETGTVTVLPPGAQPGDAGLVGWTPPETSVRLFADDGCETPRDGRAVGEVYVRSPSLMQGYLDGEGASQWKDGFFSVGDLGVLRPDGALRLVDRKYDTIISGGMNVYPAEVERAIVQHPDVASAVVCGVDDAEWGQVVCAVVAGRAGVVVDEDDLRAFLRGRIAGYKLPRRIRIVTADDMPIGSSGKPLRRVARTMFA